MKSVPLCLSALLFASCAIPTTIECLGDRCPPPELGRPGWVRGCAGVGAWIGGIFGGALSIVLLPINYPLSLLAEDGLGENGKNEFLLWPAMGCASIGHAFLGGPPDIVDYVFHRAWVNNPEDPVNSYELVPLPGPEVKKPAGAAGAGAEAVGTEGGEAK